MSTCVYFHVYTCMCVYMCVFLRVCMYVCVVADLQVLLEDCGAAVLVQKNVHV